MKPNIGTADKIIRILIAVIIAVLFFTGVVSGTAGIVLLIFAGVLVLTSLVSFCGLYTLFGITTCPKKK
jgi:uncharacterized membrane protein YtjA (UPF0391 family)